MVKQDKCSKDYIQSAYGDTGHIADITGYSPQYVRMVLSGSRNNGLIIRTAKHLIQFREDLKSYTTKYKKSLS